MFLPLIAGIDRKYMKSIIKAGAIEFVLESGQGKVNFNFGNNSAMKIQDAISNLTMVRIMLEDDAIIEIIAKGKRLAFVEGVGIRTSQLEIIETWRRAKIFSDTLANFGTGRDVEIKIEDLFARGESFRWLSIINNPDGASTTSELENDSGTYGEYDGVFAAPILFSLNRAFLVVMAYWTAKIKINGAKLDIEFLEGSIFDIVYAKNRETELIENRFKDFRKYVEKRKKEALVIRELHLD